MRTALAMVVLLGCKVKSEEKAISEPVTVEEANAQIQSDSGSAVVVDAAPRASRYPGLPECDRYMQALEAVNRCDRFPDSAKDAYQQILAQSNTAWTTSVTDESTREIVNRSCKTSADAVGEALSAMGCEFRPEPVIAEGSRNVPSEKGVPLDRAVLGSLPRPFGALQSIKPVMTRDEILAAVPDARRDGENLLVPLGVEMLTAKILIDSTDHISDVEIPMAPFPSELFEQAWGKSENWTWFDRVARWRADYGGNDNTLHIFPYKNLVDVLGAGPDLLAERTPLIGASITKLEEKLGGRLDEWSETDAEGNEVTRPRVLLPSTEVCHFDSLYVLHVENDIVTGATLTQCFDGEPERKLALAAMEKRWGRAIPARTAGDRLVFRFARPGRTVEMTEDSTVDPAGAWIVTIKR